MSIRFSIRLRITISCIFVGCFIIIMMRFSILGMMRSDCLLDLI